MIENKKKDNMNKKMMNKWIFGAALLLFAACTQDELTKQGDTLPEGMYPLQISGITLEAESSQQPWGADAPQTRVSENPDRNSSVWDGGEEIGVKIAGGEETAIYTLQADKTTLASDNPLYWKDKKASNVCAWYPVDGEVDLSKQTTQNGLVYALYAETETEVDYSTTGISLPFKHKLAKIRVVLEGSDKDKVEDVKLKTYSSCTLNTDGTLTAGSKEEFIPMVTYEGETYWEANVVPGHAIKKLYINKTTEGELNGDGITPIAAKVNTITLTVGNKEIIGGEIITEPGDYIMKGTITQSVTLSGDGITLTLDGISSTANNAIHITGGNPTLVVKDTSNSFSCRDTPILLDPDANVTIKGLTEDPTDSKLTIRTSTDKVAGIGSVSQSRCGNISIANVTLDVHGGTGEYGGAAIGTNGSFGSSCGNITIENSIVYAKGGTGASAIGLGTGSNSKSCGEIKIIRSKIFATTTYDNYYNCYAACIGHGAYAERTPVSVGKITITTNETQEEFFGTDRFKALDVNGNEVTTGFYKVGKCTNSEYQSKQTWQGVTFNGKNLADGNSNGY